ncbi:four and a half LIM domains protein 2-like [Entelurus aequoreus]|uniref:four and a half LIM domains protein 2-like n=1 Tax=Entelurus aequoreus TaxID=161455 RepID=UPI002B1D66D0|nr:four and a half LIM domains protein 2-like [Entelurus aequoreus]
MAVPRGCSECQVSLYGLQYILKEERPHCIKCYETLCCNNCVACHKLIGHTSKDVTFKDLHWHDDCFTCSKCSHPLVNQPFVTKDDMLVCTACYRNQFSAKCSACLRTILPGSKKMEHKGNSWHESCFTCKSCQQPVGTRSFVQKDANNYCLGCYGKHFALQCVHCEKPITTGGVSYYDQPWHKECFVCIGCKQQLAGQRFTSRDDSAYCFDCFCNLFAKKCANCTTPISGIGGSKYISFKQRQWHHDCFNCKRCCVSLVGRDFLSCNEDIFCPDCGKDI